MSLPSTVTFDCSSTLRICAVAQSNNKNNTQKRAINKNTVYENDDAFLVRALINATYGIT